MQNFDTLGHVLKYTGRQNCNVFSFLDPFSLLKVLALWSSFSSDFRTIYWPEVSYVTMVSMVTAKMQPVSGLMYVLGKKYTFEHSFFFFCMNGDLMHTCRSIWTRTFKTIAQVVAGASLLTWQ